ncbi:DUF3515 family protein [Streptomyces sp. NPDC051207]|uniref:DUF3515 family protein n=1 Tax=Streptomyces sp. NPDC051207 TaxID=3154641 RepID=UPI003439D446
MQAGSPETSRWRRRPGLGTWIALAVAVAAAVAGLLFVDAHRISAAPHAGDPRCEKVVSRAPDDIPGMSRDWAIGEAVASWGGRAAVLRCGAEELPPNVNLCVTANGVDWVLDETRLKEDGVSVLRTYGRSPAVEFTYTGPRSEVGGILTELNRAVDWLPQKRRCVGLQDAL